MKVKAKEALEDVRLSTFYAKRKVVVESAFVNLMENLAFNKFLLCGLLNTRAEFGVIVIALYLENRWANASPSQNIAKNGLGKLLIFLIRLYLDFDSAFSYN